MTLRLSNHTSPTFKIDKLSGKSMINALERHSMFQIDVSGGGKYNNLGNRQHLQEAANFFNGLQTNGHDIHLPHKRKDGTGFLYYYPSITGMSSLKHKQITQQLMQQLKASINIKVNGLEKGNILEQLCDLDIKLLATILRKLGCSSADIRRLYTNKIGKTLRIIHQPQLKKEDLQSFNNPPGLKQLGLYGTHKTHTDTSILTISHPSPSAMGGLFGLESTGQTITPISYQDGIVTVFAGTFLSKVTQNSKFKPLEHFVALTQEQLANPEGRTSITMHY